MASDPKIKESQSEEKSQPQKRAYTGYLPDKDPSEFTLEDILERKRLGRLERAKMSFREKIEIVEKMQEELAPFKSRRLRLQKDRFNKKILKMKNNF